MPVTQHVPSEVYGSSPAFPRWIDNIELDDASANSYTVPAGAAWVIWTSDGAVWARVSGTAAVPTADVTDGTGSMYVAAGLQIRLEAGSTLSVIRAGSSTVLLSFGVYK